MHSTVHNLDINLLTPFIPDDKFIGKLIESMTKIMSSPIIKEKRILIKSRNETGDSSYLYLTVFPFSSAYFNVLKLLDF